MFNFAFYSFLLILACILGSLGSDITTFTDDKCEKSFNALDTVNGYPDGLCKPLKITGNLEAFQIAKLDPGCAVTLYGPNDETGKPCSSPLKIVGELATCYNSSWVYYSIDGCLPPTLPSVVLPSASTTSSSSLSSSASTSSSSSQINSLTFLSSSPTSTPPPSQSSTHTGSTIGAIIGSVAFCALLIGIILLWLHRRSNQAPKPPPVPPLYELSHERTLIEASCGRRVVRKEMWAEEAATEIGRNSYMQPVELPAQIWAEDKKRRVH